MNTATRLGAFALGLAVVFGAAYGVGQVAAPGTAAEASHDAATGGHQTEHGPAAESSPAQLPGGLLVSDRGYTLTTAEAPARQFAFRITGADGRAVTGFDVAHNQRMHLIVARRDLSGFRHVHPRMDPDGTWRVASPLGGPGSWRAFADFTPTGGEPLTLGVNVDVPGAVTVQPLPAPSSTATVDGYTVTLAGDLVPGTASKLTLTVRRGDSPVTDLQPYLAAYGHLVALRKGDLAYLHVHPDGVPGDGRTAAGPQVVFHAEVPSAGAYRLYLDFQHGGTVRTAEFTAVAGGDPTTGQPDRTTPAPPNTPAPSSSAGHGTPGHGHN